MDVLPRLSNGLYTYDAAIGTIHLECSLGEANPTSRDVLSGLDKLFDALLLHVPLKLAAGYMFLGAIAFRRLGGRDLPLIFFEQLTLKTEQFSQQRAGIGNFLEEAVSFVTNWARRRHKLTVTRAHLPHSAVADAKESILAHFRYVDWEYLGL